MNDDTTGMNISVPYTNALYQFATNVMLPKWQLDLGEELLKVKMQIEGLVRNPEFDGVTDKRQYIQIPGTEMANPLGAGMIFNKLSQELTKIASDTNVPEEVARTEIEFFDDDFSLWMNVRYTDFGIKSKDYNTICESAVRLIKQAWYRSVKGWKGNLINNNTQQREIINNSPQQPMQEQGKGGGLFGKWRM